MSDLHIKGDAMKKSVFFVLLALTLSGCATTLQQRQNLAAALGRGIGQAGQNMSTETDQYNAWAEKENEKFQSRRDRRRDVYTTSGEKVGYIE